MNQQLFFNQSRIHSFDTLIQSYDQKEFYSPCRSTVPSLSLFQDAEFIRSELLTPWGISDTAEIHFEYQVAPPQGNGKPSHTDIMILDQDRAYAIEAKWTEPQYEKVSKWLVGGANPDNRLAVLQGWLSLLQPYSNKSLSVNDVQDCVYQMVHRAASASVANKFPHLVYLVFSPQPDGQATKMDEYVTELQWLHHTLGNPSGFPFYVAKASISPTAAFLQIKDLPKDNAETGLMVIQALKNSPLFEFQDVALQRI